jgi:hypothetical protein
MPKACCERFGRGLGEPDLGSSIELSSLQPCSSERMRFLPQTGYSATVRHAAHGDRLTVTTT